MFHKKTEVAMPLVFIVLALSAFMYSMTIPVEDGMFLKLISVIMFVTATMILCFTLKKAQNTVDLKDVDIKKVLITILVLAVYTVSLKWVGYFVATFALGVFTIRFLNYKRWSIIIGFSVLITAISYGVFRILLGVPLPTLFFL